MAWVLLFSLSQKGLEGLMSTRIRGRALCISALHGDFMQSSQYIIEDRIISRPRWTTQALPGHLF